MSTSGEPSATTGTQDSQIFSVWLVVGAALSTAVVDTSVSLLEAC